MLHYDGRSWSIATVPSPPQYGQSGTDFLDCPSSSQCVLLYNYQTSGGQGATEAGAIYDGRTWNSLTVPKGILIQGASCPGTNDCYAIGGTSFDNPGLTEDLYHFNGSAWTDGPQLPSPSGGVWTALGCAIGSGACWAGGGAAVSQGDPTTAVLAQFVGGRWLKASPPLVVGEVADIFCNTSTSCVAVGSAATSTNAATATPTAEPSPAPSENTVPLVFLLGS
jgi:hypothetical protein